uniref:Transmembrane protein 127 n=1 Tax=Phallusia mammillata TaxID=59560 RepID=A0A6F9DUC6_9ASCI|nr:transmembrane protein 127 [Phallusia mammillata]
MFRRADNSSNLSARTRFPSSSRKFKEKNILSAVLGTATIVVLCSSLVEPVWFTLSGGKCCHQYIGVNSFFGKMSMDELGLDGFEDENCQNLNEGNTSYSYCINATALTLIQVIILFCFLAIISSLFSFILDIIAPRKKALWKIMKRYSFGYIFTVLLAATVIGFCYWTSQEIYYIQNEEKLYRGSAVKVSFGMGVYLVAAAGGIAVLATASNLMRQYPTEEEEQAERLIAEESADESDTAWTSTAHSGSEPPPYVP